MVALIAWATERAARSESNPFAVLPNGKLQSLDKTRPEELLNAVAEAAKKPSNPLES